MKPIDELMHEHEIILHMLTGAEKQVLSIRNDRKIDVRKIQDIIEFSRNFTDKCHHAKEERHLFVKLQERGMSKDQGPIAVMLHEHDTGRELIRGIEISLIQYRTGKTEMLERIVDKLQQYIDLLRSHIAKENNILFPMGDKMLSMEDKQMLEQSFKIVEEKEIGAGEHEKYHRLAHEISG